MASPSPHRQTRTHQGTTMTMSILRRAASAVVRSGYAHTTRRAMASCPFSSSSTSSSASPFGHTDPHDTAKPYHSSPLPLEHGGGLLEYSVVYTDRAMNHMSDPFKKVRCSLHNDAPLL